MTATFKTPRQGNVKVGLLKLLKNVSIEHYSPLISCLTTFERKNASVCSWCLSANHFRESYVTLSIFISQTDNVYHFPDRSYTPAAPPFDPLALFSPWHATTNCCRCCVEQTRAH